MNHLSDLPEKGLRSREDQAKIEEFKKDNRSNWGKISFNKENSTLVKEYEFWMIIENAYPYSIVADVSHMLVPKRVFSNSVDMNEDEYQELKEIRKEMVGEYDSMILNFQARSNKHHFHIHLINWANHENIYKRSKEFFEEND